MAVAHAGPRSGGRRGRARSRVRWLGREGGCCSRAPGDGSRCRPRDLPVRDLVQHDRGRGGGGKPASAPRRSTRWSAWSRPTRRGSATARFPPLSMPAMDERIRRARRRVRRDDGPAAPLRLVRRRGGRIRRPGATASPGSRSPSWTFSTPSRDPHRHRLPPRAAAGDTPFPPTAWELERVEPVYETLAGVAGAPRPEVRTAERSAAQRARLPGTDRGARGVLPSRWCRWERGAAR